MMHSFYFVCVLCVGFVSITSFRLPPVTDYSYRESTSVELLSLEHPPSYRQRRSDDCSPDHIGVRFTADNNEVKLTLQRNYDINVNAPLFVNINGTITQETLENSENVAVYQDLESGSAILVQCVPSTRKFELFGTFYNGSEELMIEPEFNEGQEEFPDASLDNVQSRDAKSKKEQVWQDQDFKENFTISHHVIYKGKTMRPKESDFILKAGLHAKYRAGTRHNGRFKRATTAYQVELLMVADYSAYSFWFTKSSSSAEAKVLLRQFYAFVLNGIDLRYKSLTGSGFTITVLFAGLYIAETPSDALWTESRKKFLSGSVYQVNATAALGDFEAWIQSTPNLPGHDHAMLFTAYDLEVDGNNAVAGLAYMEATCTTFSQSIVEDNFDARLMTIAAHELGHSLGAWHDGTPDGTGNSCSPTLAYIMSASITLSNLGTSGFQYNKNLWKFSPCSISYFQAYINKLNSTNCLTTLSVGYNSTALSPYDQQNPGQVYSPDTQCRYTEGNDSYLCRTIYVGNYSNLCTAFYCQKSGSLYCSLSIAAEKTTCGDRKWCVAGECVTAMEAPSVNETCPFGNQPGIVANGQTCTQLVESSSFNCYNYAGSCCESCQNVYTGISGCEYGDKLTGCLARNCAFYDNTTQALCCKTCYVPPTTTTTTAPTTTTAIRTTITNAPSTTSRTTLQTTTTTTAPIKSTLAATTTSASSKATGTTAALTPTPTTSAPTPVATTAAPTPSTTTAATPPVITTAAPTPTPTTVAQTPVTTTAAPTPTPTTVAPTPAATTAAPTPSATTAGPTLVTTTAARTPSTTTAALTPFATTAAPTPSTTTAAPPPSTTTAAPIPTPTTVAQTPVTTTAAPTPTPTTVAPTPVATTAAPTPSATTAGPTLVTTTAALTPFATTAAPTPSTTTAAPPTFTTTAALTLTTTKVAPTPVATTAAPTSTTTTVAPTPVATTADPTPSTTTAAPTPISEASAPTPSTSTAARTPNTTTAARTPNTTTGAPASNTTTVAPTPSTTTAAQNPSTTTTAPTPVTTSAPTPSTTMIASTPSITTAAQTPTTATTSAAMTTTGSTTKATTANPTTTSSATAVIATTVTPTTRTTVAITSTTMAASIPTNTTTAAPATNTTMPTFTTMTTTTTASTTAASTDTTRIAPTNSTTIPLATVTTTTGALNTTTTIPISTTTTATTTTIVTPNGNITAALTSTTTTAIPPINTTIVTVTTNKTTPSVTTITTSTSAPIISTKATASLSTITAPTTTTRTTSVAPITTKITLTPVATTTTSTTTTTTTAASTTSATIAPTSTKTASPSSTTVASTDSTMTTTLNATTMSPTTATTTAVASNTTKTVPTTTPMTAPPTTSTTTTTAAPTTTSKAVFPSTSISTTPLTTNTTTEQQVTKKTAVTVRLNYNVSSADNLSDSSTYSRYVDIVGESLREYYTRKVGQDAQINIRDIRRGSLIVEYDVIIKNLQTAQVALAKANIDLAAGENITVGGQVSGVESMVVENMTVPIGNSSSNQLCTVYILISGGCPDNYKCVVFNNSPMCQPITTTIDIVPVTVAAAVAGLVIVIAVVALICSLQRRSKHTAKHLADLPNDSSSDRQMKLPRPVYSKEGYPRRELSNVEYPNDFAHAHKWYPGYSNSNSAFDGGSGEINSHYYYIDPEH